MQKIYTITELEMLTKTELVKLCIHKNQQACTFLYNMFAPRMMYLCSSFTKREDIAQDIMQEGFITVFKNLNRLKNPEGIYSWIYRIMLNRCINYVNRHQMVYDNIDAAVNIAAPKHSDKLEYRDLCREIDKLSDKYKIVFVKHEIEGCSLDEISKDHNINPSTVRSILCRAKAQLRQQINTAF